MSKERARRREAREREAAVRAAARAEEQARRERREARTRLVTARLPTRRRRTVGILAARRRRELVTTVGILVVVNVAVWVFFPGWAARALVLAVSLLAAPVLHTMLFRRRS